MSDYFGDLPSRPPAIRDPLAEYRKAVEAQIALHRSVGEEPTPYLLHQLAELDARQGRKPEPAPELEHAAADPLPENTVRRGPGRPRKPSDADRAAGR